MRNARVFLALTARDFRSQYLGSLIGAPLVLLQPLLFCVLLAFVVGSGIRGTSESSGQNEALLVWLISGYAPWFLFSQAVSSAPQLVPQYSFLLRHNPGAIALLPAVRSAANVPVHLALLIACVILRGELPFNSAFVEFLGAFALLAAFTCSCTLLSATLGPFAKDTQKANQILIQWGFFLTPIIWDFSMVPERFRALLALNPAFTIVEEYRHWLVPGYDRELPVYAFPTSLLVVVIIIAIAHASFRKLRPHFGEVVH